MFEEDELLFYANYDKLINEILNKRDLLSGTHVIDPIKAELWISSQSTERRQMAARNLLDNTHYISFNQLFELSRKVIIELYKRIKGKDIYLYVGIDEKSSQYFMSMIFIYFIRLLGYDEPNIISNLHDNIQYLDGKTVINFDDCCYSGGQSYHTSMDLYEIIKSNKIYINYYLVFAVATEYALNILNNAEDLYWVKSLYGMKVPLLKSNFETFEEYMDLYYYFSPYTETGTPPANIYFDHKIASVNSTFSYVLNIGPVLPKYLHYDNLNKKINDYMIEYYDRKNLIGKDGLKFRNDVISQYLSDMKEDEGYGDDNIVSIPFIFNYEREIELDDITYYELMTSFNDFYPLDPKYESVINELIDSKGFAITCFYKTLNYINNI